MFRALLLLAAAACSPAVTTAAADASAPFVNNAPSRYEAVSSVVFQYRWFKFPALGAMSVDARNHSFALVGLSQLGISVFELSEKNGVVKSRMPGPLLKRNPRLADGAAADVRNMFFDLAPAPDARRRDTGTRAIFTQRTPAGILEHHFDKASGLLAEKRLVNSSRCPLGRTVVWVARYEDYTKADGKTYAAKVSFKHRKLHYAISTQVRQMRIKP